MMKNNRWKIIVSSLIILLPIVFGLVFWNNLPDTMATHWGTDGTANGWSSKFVAVFMLPLLMLALHWFCIWWTAKDQGNRHQNRKVMGLLFWIIPIISLFANGTIYAASYGGDQLAMAFVPLLLGLMFVFIGNYMPKCKQNMSMGVKVKWTLENEENWNATHRVAGKVWFTGGLAVMACVFLPEKAMICVVFPAIFVIAFIPMIYSWLYHKKQVREGTAVIKPIVCDKSQKIAIRTSMIIVSVLLILIAGLMFTGEITMVFSEDSFTVDCSYWNELTVEYAVIDSVEYREQDQRGMRVSGFSSARLLAGAFRNDEFGNHTRYSYTGCDECVVVSANGKTLVLNAADAEATKQLYETLQSHIQ